MNLHGAEIAFVDEGFDATKGCDSLTSMKSEQDLSELCERDLLTRIAQQESEALALLYDRFAGVLFSVAAAILKDPAQAEDVLQEVFFQIWERASVYDSQLGKPLSWAVTLTRNKAIDRLRSTQRRNRLIEGIMLEITNDTNLHNSVACDVVTNETAALVRSAMTQLPAQQREAIELAFFGGLTQLEIASALKQPLGTIKARIRRGMLQLRDALEIYL
ncbi:MAG: sigma-70 family RNA polymerase sigma factor [Verrucomicrobiota bacterium]